MQVIKLSIILLTVSLMLVVVSAVIKVAVTVKEAKKAKTEIKK